MLHAGTVTTAVCPGLSTDGLTYEDRKWYRDSQTTRFVPEKFCANLRKSFFEGPGCQHILLSGASGSNKSGIAEGMLCVAGPFL